MRPSSICIIAIVLAITLAPCSCKFGDNLKTKANKAGHSLKNKLDKSFLGENNRVVSIFLNSFHKSWENRKQVEEFIKCYKAFANNIKMNPPKLEHRPSEDRIIHLLVEFSTTFNQFLILD